MTEAAGGREPATGGLDTVRSAGDDDARSAIPHVMAVCLAVATFALVFVGGLVTSAEAGLAVPDWPLSYGHINPPGWWGPRNVRFEHGHRLIGWFVGFWTILLALVIQVKDQRPWMRKLGWAALAAVIAQGILGGVRVTAMETYMAAIHGCTGQAFFCLVVAIVLFTSRGWMQAPPPVPHPETARLRRLALLSVLFVYIQVVLGSIVRHMRAGHQIEYVLPHLIWGMVAAVVVGRAGLCAWSVGDRVPGLTRPGLVLAGGVLLQIMVGLATYFVNTITFEELDRPVSQFTTATVHQTLGAVVLASSVVLFLRARRNELRLRDAETTGEVFA